MLTQEDFGQLFRFSKGEELCQNQLQHVHS